MGETIPTSHTLPQGWQLHDGPNSEKRPKLALPGRFSQLAVPNVTLGLRHMTLKAELGHFRRPNGQTLAKHAFGPGAPTWRPKAW